MSVTRTGSTVFTVHWARDNQVGEIAAIFTDRLTAERHAREYSQQARMVYAAVTAFGLDEVGTRRGVSWFRSGKLQRTPWPTVSMPVFDSPDRGAAQRRRDDVGVAE